MRVMVEETELLESCIQCTCRLCVEKRAEEGDECLTSFEVMMSLQFYQWGMDRPFAMGVYMYMYLSSLMNFEIRLSPVVIVVTPLTTIMKVQVIDLVYWIVLSV